RALLLIGARDDDLCKIEGYEKLYERAREPKKLVVLPITHYEIYSGKWFDESARLAREWFERFLKKTRALPGAGRKGETMSQVQAGEIKLYYEVHGSGEPLLMIMGLGSSSATWSP